MMTQGPQSLTDEQKERIAGIQSIMINSLQVLGSVHWCAHQGSPCDAGRGAHDRAVNGSGGGREERGADAGAARG